MAEKRALFSISSVGLRRYERVIKIDEADVALLIQEGMLRMGEDAAYAMQNHAPFRTGTLSDAIQVVGRNRRTRRPNVRVGIDVAQLGPFDYTNVTRFGRRAVEAGGRSLPARSYSRESDQNQGISGVQNRPFRSRMLRFEPGPPGSGFMHRRRVRAYRPKADWVKQSEGEVRAASEKVMAEITEAIDALFRSNRARGRQGGSRPVYIRRASRTGRMR